MQKLGRKPLLLIALILAVIAVAAWRLRNPSKSDLSHAAPSPPEQPPSLPDDLRRAFESGQPVRIPFPSKDGAMAPLPPGDTLAGPQDMPLLPPPDPAEEQRSLQAKTLDDIRNSTPEQRLERLRQLQPKP